MADFVECMRLRAKAAEDIYFAEYNRKLIEALHEKQAREAAEPAEHPDHQPFHDDVLKSDR
ncbi:hypothetical protein FCL40_05680 [Ferrimonas sediminicola]|uniref:Uncharacterized protein n=1 Tax=Ferrimonas sediminicola TaxID=2569538 RepID=A0A4U1BH01_9GAMM|nr:hypothetical protein [Ferrimonas sediminicola]TKB50638.1 hypothetical protein FCL40_05680 [Ferrimonas sediminicola]